MSDYGSIPPPPPPPPFGGFQTPQMAAAGVLANWGQRVGAYLIDFALILPFLILQFAFTPKTVTTNVNGTVNVTQSGGSALLGLLMSLIVLAITVYNRWYKGGQGQTFGKQKLGLTLVGEASGQPIGMAKAFVRDLAHILDSVFYIGFLFPLWDAKKQTFSDKLLGTVVTKA